MSDKNSEGFEGMLYKDAEDICVSAMVNAFGGKCADSKKFFKAIRVLNMRDAGELYESLSKEFVRKGIASNRFSELEQLFKIAEISLKDYRDQQQKIDERDKIIEQLNKRLSEAIDLLYGSSDIPRETIKELLGENEGD